MHLNKRFIIATVYAVIFASVIFYIGLETGLSWNPAAFQSSEASSSTILNANTSLLWDAIQMVKNKYYNIKDVTDNDILYGAVNGVMQSLKDPYSVFFNPSDAQKFSEDLNGNFGGVGMEVGMKNDQLTVIAPLKGNPAYEVGLKAGDAILEIDTTSTAGMDVDSAVKLIWGDVGTKVDLLISREGWKEPKDFKITRANVQVPTIDWKMEEGNIAYIQLYNFNSNAGSLFYNAALSALLQGTKGVILDLRNNPGGYLDVANDIAGWFMDRGSVVVREDFRSGEQNVMRSNGPSALANIPVVVLVNGGSASASEILAGALRDDRGIKLIGEKTFGKGSVQEIENLQGGSSMKISIAEWLTPKGRHINKVGINPDIEVKVDPNSTSTVDIQLNKALEVIKQEIAK